MAKPVGRKRGRKPKARRVEEFPPLVFGIPWARPVQVSGPVDPPGLPTKAELREGLLRRALRLSEHELRSGRPLPPPLERELLELVKAHDIYLDETRLCDRVNELAREGVPVSRDGAFEIVGREFNRSPPKVEEIYYAGPKFLGTRAKP